MSTRTVLVIEDSESQAETLERGLRASMARSTVILVQNSEDAELTLFSGNDRALTPDLVVVDLPADSRGVDLVKRVRADSRTKSVPVVTLSGDMDDRSIQDLYRSGANSYLDKPVDVQELVNVIATATRYWLGLNMSAPTARAMVAER